MHILSNIIAGAAGAAMVIMPVSPAFSAPMNAPVKAESGLGDNAQDYRRHRRRYDHDRIDGGDIAVGIGILAGIAIIADIASKSKKKDGYTKGDRYPDSYPQDSRDSVPSSTQDDRNYSSGNDLGSAVSLCSEAAERSAGGSARVEEIRSVTREGSGWQVIGNLSGGARGFTCATSAGQVEYVRLNDTRAI